jgi:pre-rRNA-processing protein TSR3
MIESERPFVKRASSFSASCFVLPSSFGFRASRAMSPLPTIIVIHPRERRSKCTVEALRCHDGFVFWTFPEQGAQPLDGYVRLGIGGPLLSADDRNCGLLVLDGTWRLADRMEKFFTHVPLRSLPPVLTAYPRSSYVYPDPAGGLATIEAIYAAYRLLGRSCDGLLDDYHWSTEFLSRNNWTCR